MAKIQWNLSAVEKPLKAGVRILSTAALNILDFLGLGQPIRDEIAAEQGVTQEQIDSTIRDALSKLANMPREKLSELQDKKYNLENLFRYAGPTVRKAIGPAMNKIKEDLSNAKQKVVQAEALSQAISSKAAKLSDTRDFAFGQAQKEKQDLSKLAQYAEKFVGG